jgi:hypothetical protein
MRATSIRADELLVPALLPRGSVRVKAVGMDRVRVAAVEPCTTSVRTEHGHAADVPAVRVRMALGWWTVYLAAEGVAVLR